MVGGLLLPRVSRPIVCIHRGSDVPSLTQELALDAHGVLTERWAVGWLQPVATVDAFADWLDRIRVFEPDGRWGHVTEIGNTLIYVNDYPDDHDAWAFPLWGETDSGEALYVLAGFCWVFWVVTDDE